ncbi:MAG: hypothetical protein ACRCYQ_14440, partial [Nocardioides sp.]
MNTVDRDMPDQRMLSLAGGTARQFDYYLTLYKRTWKGSVVTGFLTPIVYVLAMGVLLGGFIEGDPDELEGATSYLVYVVPGLIASQAMSTAVLAVTYPVMGMLKWQRTYHGMIATPLEPIHLAAGTLAFTLFQVASGAAVFIGVMAL